MEAYNIVSFIGIFLLLALAWLFSTDRNRMNWRVILWGIGLQIIFAFFIFIVPAGGKLFLVINDVVVRILDSAGAGTRFLFGRLALPPGTSNSQGETSLGFFLAFQALPTIVFFASLMSALYFIGIMPLLIRGFAYLFTRLMRISGAESLCAASNIFVGIESALTIRPYLDNITRSELCLILTAGMSTIASSVLALYVFILHGQFPTIAGHLVSASVLSAPAAIVMSKILLPESDVPRTMGEQVVPYYERESNLIEAIINGANAGVRLCVGIAALLLAFLGMVALVDLGLGFLGGWINTGFGWNIDWSLRNLLGYCFYPLGLVIGIPHSDVLEASRIIGERLVTTEVQSYQDLAHLMTTKGFHHPRSSVITVYALCGFAHLASLAIFIGGIAALVPARTKDLAKVGPRALLAATLACLLTAAVAGTFFTTKGSILLNP